MAAKFPTFASLFFAFIHLFNFNVQPVSGQYLQEYVLANSPNGGLYRQWRPTKSDAYQPVLDIHPNAVFLIYNCHYMTAICDNVKNFFATDRGKQLPASFDGTMFVMDFSTDKSNTKRGPARRDKSCPAKDVLSRGVVKWKKTHKCPEGDQKDVWRNDKVWHTTAISHDQEDLDEENIPKNILEHERNPDQSIKNRSYLFYTCDEFPAASWIEGGSQPSFANGSGGFAETRCAAMRCKDAPRINKRAVAAEQDWQKNAHNKLGSLLRGSIRRQNLWPPGADEQDKRDQVALFYFRVMNEPNGIAAQAIRYTDAEHTIVDPATPKNILIAKRREKAHDLHNWAKSVTVPELLALNHANGDRHVIHADSPSPAQDPAAWAFELETGHGIASNLTEAAASRSPVRRAFNRRERRKQIRQSPLATNATASDIAEAREIVEKALDESAKRNALRLANPLRNNYNLKPGTKVRRSDNAAPALLEITDEIARAAALLSEVEARESTGNYSKIAAAPASAAKSGTYWMEHIQRKGTVPWGDDPSYKVFRNVADYGAVGDGVTDDTKAINKALRDGKRCAENCNGSTLKNAIVYFPPGTYRISTSIDLPFGTQVIGDANNWPTLIASNRFIGLGVLSTDKYTGAGGGADGLDDEWYINTANFYRQIRNLRIDITATRPSQNVACIHYQVAQATSIQNVELIAKSGTGQQGIFAENGSGGVISDITFTGGGYGIYGGNQQFTAQRLTFNGCDVGVQVIWDWGWVWKSITMKNVKTGFRLLPKDKIPKKRSGSPGGAGGSAGHIGSVSVIDSSFEGVDTAIMIETPNSKPGTGSTGVIVENVAFQGVGKAVADTSGATLLAASARVDHWALGPTYKADGTRAFSMGQKISGFSREKSLTGTSGSFFERAKPQYQDRSLADFVHVKDFGAKGDGVTDDTAAFQSALIGAGASKILFVDAGSYILTNTVTVPVGAKIVGETWSQLVATGSYFGDAKNPKVMFQVGREGQEGTVEMQDLIFTSKGPTPGLILVEWNILADRPGSAALWDCHVRIGGATGTKLTPAECPPARTGVNKGCEGASLMMHITSKASGYFENMWLWVADHMIDDPDLEHGKNEMEQTSIYVARGLLIESVAPTWLYGTASEHAVFYQYNFHKAKKVFAGMIQTESPYYQPTPKPPAPFDAVVGVFRGDPSYECKKDDKFNGCDESWGVIIERSENIFVAGAGVYSWFSTYSQDCIDKHACQNALILLKDNYSNVRMQHIITIGGAYSIVQDGKGISAMDNLNVDSHPAWSQISVFDVGTNAPDFAVWIDPSIWNMETPSVTCSVPCTLKIPPWLGATRVVDYPLLTVSDGSWTSTITQPPITMTSIEFEHITITANAKDKRQAIRTLFPVPTTTPAWPQAAYIGPDGKKSMTGPSKPFPTPPKAIGPNEPAPAGGQWPKVPIHLIVGGQDNLPAVEICFYDSLDCFAQPWEYGNKPWPYPGGTGIGDPEDDDSWGEDGPAGDEMIACSPTTTSTTTTTTTTSDTPSETPPSKPSPRAGDPALNKRDCYKNTRGIDRDQAADLIGRFCGEMERQLLTSGQEYANQWPYSPPNQIAFYVRLWFGISKNTECRWVGGKSPAARSLDGVDGVDGQNGTSIARRDITDSSLCARYMDAVVDSCNCGGINGKEGGRITNDCFYVGLHPVYKY